MSDNSRAIIAPEVIALYKSGAKITSVGLIVDRPLDFPDWADIGPSIGKGHRAYSWAAGDWIKMGMEKYPDMYTQAMDVTGLSLGRLRNLKSLCDRVPHHIRNPNLTISHHECVAQFPENFQKQLLDLAERFNIDRDTFRELVDDIKKGADPQTIEDNGQIVVTSRKTTPEAIIERARHVALAWRKGQGQMSMTLHQALEELAEILGDDEDE